MKGRVETVLNFGGEDGISNSRNNYGISRQNEQLEEGDEGSDISDEEMHDLQEDLDDLVAEDRARSGSWNVAFSTK